MAHNCYRYHWFRGLGLPYNQVSNMLCHQELPLQRQDTFNKLQLESVSRLLYIFSHGKMCLLEIYLECSQLPEVLAMYILGNQNKSHLSRQFGWVCRLVFRIYNDCKYFFNTQDMPRIDPPCWSDLYLGITCSMEAQYMSFHHHYLTY